MNTLPFKAKALIGIAAISSLVFLTKAMANMGQVHDYTRFLAYLTVAVITARCKVTLPKLNGSMSVNLPFIMVALIELSLPEAMAIAAVSTFAQCFWPESKKRNMAQVVFNVSVLVLVVQATWMALQFGSRNMALAIAAGGATMLLANTVPVAAIIAATENASLARTWSRILQLTFPYFMLAAGVAALVKLANHAMGWEMPLFILPAMLLVHHSYKNYFQHVTEFMSAVGPRVAHAKAGSY